MKVLLDSCVWPGARAQIESAGHNAEWVGDWAADPGDEEILAHAARNLQIIVTLDKDFGELAVAFGRPHAGIVRLVDVRHTEQGALCLRLLEAYGPELVRRAIVTAGPGSVRVRPERAEDQ